MTETKGAADPKENKQGQTTETDEEAYHEMVNGGLENGQNKAMLMMFILPVALSAVFFLADCIEIIYGLKTAEQEIDWSSVILMVLDRSLGYFPVTFISAVASAFLQQFLYKIPVGLEDNKAAGLFFFMFVYSVVFTLYLALKALRWYEMTLGTFALTIWFAVWVWRALKTEVRGAAVLSSFQTAHFVGKQGS